MTEKNMELLARLSSLYQRLKKVGFDLSAHTVGELDFKHMTPLRQRRALEFYEELRENAINILSEE